MRVQYCSNDVNLPSVVLSSDLNGANIVPCKSKSWKKWGPHVVIPNLNVFLNLSGYLSCSSSTVPIPKTLCFIVKLCSVNLFSTDMRWLPIHSAEHLQTHLGPTHLFEQCDTIIYGGVKEAESGEMCNRTPTNLWTSCSVSLSVWEFSHVRPAIAATTERSDKGPKGSWQYVLFSACHFTRGYKQKMRILSLDAGRACTVANYNVSIALIVTVFLRGPHTPTARLQCCFRTCIFELTSQKEPFLAPWLLN